MRIRTAVAAGLLSVATCTFAAPVADMTPIPRKLPPMGVPISHAEKQKLESELAAVQKRIKALESKPELADLLADVKMYEKAVRYAIALDEFYPPKAPANPKPGAKPAAEAPPRGLSFAHDHMKAAAFRLDALEKGQHPWTTAKGQVVRGYVSEIDGSAQPYGLEIPEDVDLAKPTPLCVWLHGRGDDSTDLYFVKSRDGGKRGEFQPKGAIVLHVFGRQCVGYKSAGEVDVFEAIASVKKRYKIDENRVFLAGFSMGGAGAWHLGAHYADQWAVVHTGAGFVDVKNYQKLTADKMPPAIEQKMWGVYDVPDYVHNLFNVPVVSYSGEIDGQRASAELMAKVFKAEGHELTHLIGPGVPHKYEPGTLKEVLKRVNEYVEKGRDPYPKHVELQTRTLRYNKQFWVEVSGLAEHWADTRVDAKITGDDAIDVKTQNVSGLKLHEPFAAGTGGTATINVTIDGTIIGVPRQAFASGKAVFSQVGGKWHSLTEPEKGLHKTPGLQGPIDDAFMAPFLFVAPSGEAAGPIVQKWVEFEMKHQQDRWQSLMRGDLRIKKDTDVTPEDIKKYNLICWGDAKSNKIIAQLAGKIPVTFNEKRIAFNGTPYPATTHVASLIYPNPLNPAKYVVLNSGITFREAHDGTNSLQNPKLGDWAIIDVTTAANAAAPGKVVDNGLFDEAWQVKPSGEKKE